MKLNTPYYEINAEQMFNNLNKMKNSLQKHWGNYIIGYSYKTNALPWIINFFQRCGCYAEVVSEDEYNLCKFLNTQKSKFIYNGPIKSKATFLEAARNGGIVNIDSKRELDWLDDLDKSKKYNIGIRVNFDVEKYCGGQSSSGKDGGRFGFCIDNGEFEKALDLTESKGIKISGIHMHTSSKTRSLDIYSMIGKVACRIKKAYDLNLSFIDVGGGFFGGLNDKPQFEDYFRILSSELKEEYNAEDTKIIVEPGMSVVGAYISYVVSVIDVKDTTYNRFVIIDGSRTNIDPLMRKSSYFYDLYCDDNRKEIEKQVICGYTCMENDRLMEIENKTELFPGDRIVFNKVGAYTMCLTPLFISYYPDVYVKYKNKRQLVRKKWTEKEFVQNSIWGGDL